MRMRLVGMVAMAALAIAAPGSELQAQKRGPRDLLKRDEIMASAQKDMDLLKAIAALRPNMLEPPRGNRSLGGSDMAPLAIFVDRIRQSGRDALLLIPANTVAEVRYLEPAASQNEFGMSANGGALVIKRYRADKDSTTKPPR